MPDNERHVDLEAAPAMTLVGMSRNFTMENRQEIGRMWQQFYAKDHGIPAVPGSAMYGVSYNVKPDGTFSYAIGFQPAEPEIADLPTGFCTLSLSEGRYAVLRRFGPPPQLAGDFDWMFMHWLPGSGVTQRAGAVFERYPPDPRSGPEGMAYEIWVPVEARS